MLAIFLGYTLVLGASARAEQSSPPAPSAPHDDPTSYHISSLTITGLEFTKRDWLESYIGFPFAGPLSAEDARLIEKKLLTTAVFSQVRVLFTPRPRAAGNYDMHIDVVERWTMIPVLRAAYGGGTPLKVLGAYDVHAFGRLLTFGGEAQQYGNAEPGSVFYLKAPRHAGGRVLLASEVWNENRIRPVYGDSTKHPKSRVLTRSKVLRLSGLMAEGSGAETRITGPTARSGLETVLVQERPLKVVAHEDKAEALLPHLGSVPQTTSHLRLLATWMHDDIDLNILDADGGRTVVKAGPSYLIDSIGERPRWHSNAEVEGFYYKLWPHGFNLGIHAVIGSASLGTTRSRYFIGGLDSVRGYPDSYLQGTKAAWANFELRHMSWKPKPYLWVQTLVFCDSGSAADSWQEFSSQVIGSCGGGLRFAIPQVNRMIFRIDYAYGILGEKTQGIAAGMNQFFDPFKPLPDR